MKMENKIIFKKNVFSDPADYQVPTYYATVKTLDTLRTKLIENHWHNADNFKLQFT